MTWARGHLEHTDAGDEEQYVVQHVFEGVEVMLDKSSKRWRDLVTGKIALQTDNLGLQMYLKRTTTKLATQGTPEELEKAITEIHSFFVKYERVLQKELANISR
jgi:hypothetical protein